MPIIMGAQSITEDLSSVGGFIAGCGQASAYVIAHIVKGEPLSTNELTQIIKDSINAGKATVHGSQPVGSQYVLSQFGISSQVKNVSPNQLGAFLNSELAQNIPVEIGVNQGHVLSNEQSGLHGHYVTIVGTDPSSGNYITADPNSPQSKVGGFTFNSLQQLINAQPFAEIIPTGAGPGSIPGITGIQNTVNQITDLPSAIAALPQNLTSSLQNAIGNAVKTQESNLGISGAGDIGWRIVLIIFGFILMISAILFIGFDLLDKSNIEVAGTRV